MRNSTQLEIPKPCHEDWNKMTPEAQGRFCGSCQKTVIDFSLMSDQQVLEYLSRSRGDTCGRFANDQLGRALEETKQLKKSRWKFVLNLMIPAFLISGKVYSQGSPRVKTCTQKIDIKKKYDQQIHVKRDTISPMGTVVDDVTGDPIPAVSIRWVGSSNATFSNEKGEFSMCAAPVGENKLEISCIGYETLIVDAPLLGRHVTYRINQDFKQLEPVVVTGYGTTVGRLVTTGAIVRITREEINKRPVFMVIKDSLRLLSFRKSIKVYPNPVIAGSQFFFELNNIETGTYQVEIIDASGKIVREEQVNVVFKKQVISISTASHWSKGIYWVRLIGSKKDKAISGKLVIR